MKRDIRKLFKEDSESQKGQMQEGHEARFLQSWMKSYQLKARVHFSFFELQRRL